MLDLLLREIKEKGVAPFINLLKRYTFSPNYLSFAGFVCGLICVYYLVIQQNMLGLLFWGLNRFFDGIDGSYARMTGQQTQFGGYFDIILDFTVYSLIPIGIAAPRDDKPTFLILALMEGLFFVNAGSLFQLSAILEQKNQGAKQRGELTTVTMPSALIEGCETMVFFSLFMLVPFEFVKYLYLIFTTGVTINVIYRLQWAYRSLTVSSKTD